MEKNKIKSFLKIKELYFYIENGKHKGKLLQYIKCFKVVYENTL